MEDLYGSSDDEYCNRVYDDGDDSDYGNVLDSESDRAPSCKVITKDSLLAAQKVDLQRVMDLLSIKEHHARTLLIHYRWDVEKVFTVLVEKGKERLYAEAGVTVESKGDPSLSESATCMTCEICFDDIPAAKTTIMDCGHSFCNDCWTEHFIVQINEGQSKRIKCMADKCNAICDEGKIRDLVGVRDPNLAEKFERFLLESYIEDNKNVKWCPSVPHCGNAICAPVDEYCEVECACGLQFCFSCASETHSPCSCVMWEMWMKKCSDESETVNWIAVNTKYCPKCNKPVEKNGGCNLVQCICGQAFCWLCGGATGFAHTWHNIEGHTCGRYNADKKTIDARKQLFRYTHYYNRYKAHTDSLKAEASVEEKLQKKVLNLESKELTSKTPTDFSWVMNGFYRLVRSRQILSYSYPFAYYVFGDELLGNDMTQEENEIKQHLFEDHQQQLEANIERLSLFLEEPFDTFPKDKVLEMQMRIVNLSGVIDNFCRKLYDCIDNDLLIHLQSNHIVAAYISTGAVKAVELDN